MKQAPGSINGDFISAEDACELISTGTEVRRKMLGGTRVRWLECGGTTTTLVETPTGEYLSLSVEAS